MKLRSFFRGVLIFFGLLYVLLVYILTFMRPSDYKRCDLYTKEMNGGIHFFQGKDYRIELCGLNGIIQPENFQYDEVRLRVFSMEGELLAQRYYSPLLGLYYAKQLKYENNNLVYNDGEGKGFQTRMSMPPSRWDWIRARLPRMWP